MANGFLIETPSSHGDEQMNATANVVVAQEFTCPGSGIQEITEIGAFGDTDVDPAAFSIGIFTDDAANDCPESQVANSDADLTMPAAGPSDSYAYSTYPLLSGGVDYWLAIVSHDSDLNLDRFSTGGNTEQGFVSGGAWPTPAEWESLNSRTWDMGFWAVYQAQAASGIEITPSPITVVSSGIDPFVIQSGIQFTPSVITVVSSGIDPGVVLSGLQITPSPVTVVSSGIDPGVVLASISFTPVEITVVSSGIDPGVIEGALVFTPSPITVVSSGIDPGVVLSGLQITPSPVTVVSSGIDPFVIAGSGLEFTPSPITVVSSGVEPAVVLGTVTFTPSPVTVVASGIDPTVIDLGDITYTPSAITVVSSGIDPIVIQGTSIFTPSPITVVAGGADPIVFERFPGTPGFIGMFWQPLYPDPVTGLDFLEVADTVEITWDVAPWDVISSGLSSEYEVWSSVGDQNNYNLIATINNVEIPSGSETITIVDETYDAIGTIYYKLYHISVGHYSNPLESGIALTYSVPDPTNLDVSVALNNISLSWTNDISRILAGVSIVHHAANNIGDLMESSGVELFNGTAGGFTYEVPEADIVKWHQFWISSVTRTT